VFLWPVTQLRSCFKKDYYHHYNSGLNHLINVMLKPENGVVSRGQADPWPRRRTALRPSSLTSNHSLGWRKLGGLAVGQGISLAWDFEGPPDVMLLVACRITRGLGRDEPMGLA
jgi:hypothetical protein